MATLEIKDAKGKVVGKHELSEAIRAFEPSAALLHQAVVTEEANSRQGTQKTKTRSEVRGGGRKPYKQKKTGNARQGTIRAPHYAHGGMALAITPRDYSKKLNRKERRSAIVGALNAQVDAGNVIIADKIAFAAPKTKDAIALLKAHSLDDVRRVLVVVAAYDESTFKCFRNIPSVTVRTAPSTDSDAKTATFSTRDLLVAHKILVTADALKAIESVWAGEEQTATKKAPKTKAKAESKVKAEPKAKPAASAKAKAEPKAKPKAAAPKKAAAKKDSSKGEKA